MDFSNFVVSVSETVQRECAATSSDQVLLAAPVQLTAKIGELGVFALTVSDQTPISGKNQNLLISILSDIVLYATAIGIIQEVGMDVIDDEFIENAALNVDDERAHDRYLCVNAMAIASTDLMDFIWNPEFHPEDDEEEEPEVDPVGSVEEDDGLSFGVDGLSEEVILESSQEFDAILEIITLARVFLSYYGENQVFSDVFRKSATKKIL